jgi:hypothetical protein
MRITLNVPLFVTNVAVVIESSSRVCHRLRARGVLAVEVRSLGRWLMNPTSGGSVTRSP